MQHAYQAKGFALLREIDYDVGRSAIEGFTLFSRIIICLAIAGVPCQTLATQAFWSATIYEVMVDSANFGHCMAATEPGPETVLPNCSSKWVTFSCSGDFNSKNAGNLKLQAAQLALITGNRVAILATDAKKHNGYCFSPRVQNLND